MGGSRASSQREGTPSVSSSKVAVPKGATALVTQVPIISVSQTIELDRKGTHKGSLTALRHPRSRKRAALFGDLKGYSGYDLVLFSVEGPGKDSPDAVANALEREEIVVDELSILMLFLTKCPMPDTEAGKTLRVRSYGSLPNGKRVTAFGAPLRSLRLAGGYSLFALGDACPSIPGYSNAATFVGLRKKPEEPKEPKPKRASKSA